MEGFIMAERRMFAKTIIDSDAFLEMPQSTQVLYFHLSMRGDDDGFINNPKSIMRIVGAKDDDLKILAAKKFIIPFESGVVVIKHWKIHNYIQNDRKTNTKYLDELSSLELDENKSYRLIGSEIKQLEDVGNLDTGCTRDGYTGKDRLGEVRLGEVSIKTTYAKTETVLGEEDVKENVVNLETKRKPVIPYQEIVNAYHEHLPKLAQVYKLTDSRKVHIKTLWNDELDDLDTWVNYFKHISRSDFLMGRSPPTNGRSFVADFDFIIKPGNFVKISEDKYHGKKIQR